MHVFKNELPSNVQRNLFSSVSCMGFGLAAASSDEIDIQGQGEHYIFLVYIVNHT